MQVFRNGIVGLFPQSPDGMQELVFKALFPGTLSGIEGLKQRQA